MQTIKIKINDLDDLTQLSKAYKDGRIKLNISKISRELNCSRKTVRNHLNGNVKKERKKRIRYLDKYEELIIELLNDGNREFEYIDHIYNYLKREYSITCVRSTFNRYIRSNDLLNKKFKENLNNTFTVRFETSPGQQVQFDLKERVKLIYDTGEVEVVNIATLTLGFSRYNFRKIVLNINFDTVSQFLAECFESMGGVPKEIVIDNIKCLVDKARDKNGNEAILNSKFIEFLKNYNLICKPCMPRRPQTKGKTETQNKWPSQLKNYNGTYTCIDDIHDKLKILNDEDNSNISQATKLPRNLLYKREKDGLNQLPTTEIRSKYHLSYNKVNVSNESLISYKSKKYSVPKRYIGKTVDLVISNSKNLQIYYNNRIIAQHYISNNNINIDIKHKLYYERENNIKQNSNNKTSIITDELRRLNYD